VMQSKSGGALLRCLCLLSMCIPLHSVAQELGSDSDPLSRFSDSLSSLARKISPAVVEIFTSSYTPDGDDDSTTSFVSQQVIGSGVILSSDGYIVTNAHVIKGAKRIRIVLNPQDSYSAPEVLKDNGTRYDATVVGAHEETDLAILKIEAKDLPTIPFADYSQLRQGQIVIAVGNPVGMKNSVSIGIVSSVARESSGGKPVALIQTDAALNPGSSGGALVDTSGRLVGIPCEVMTGERLGFAIPSDVVKVVYEQIREHGSVHRGEIGVTVQSITPLLAKGLVLPRPWGIIVSDVAPGSPAEISGLKPQDVILEVDGKAIGSGPEFETLLYFKSKNNHLRIKIFRVTGITTMDVAVTDRPVASGAMLGADPDKNLVRKLHVFAEDLDKKQIEKIPGLRLASGALITGKISDAQNLAFDLSSGDIIHSINGRSVSTVDTLVKELDKIQQGEPVVLWIERQRKFVYVAFEAN
jgi:serine protease Do